MRNFLLTLVFACVVAPAFGQKFAVKIVGRQTNETDYTYVVPGYSTANVNANVSCLGGGDNVNCDGSARSTGWSRPAQQVSFRVSGATFSLLLPDGRVAVVNCRSKFAERFAGARGNRRSCRMPLVNDIQAEFKGDKAKLKWPVSIDGKKMESETYRILAVLPKRNVKPPLVAPRAAAPKRGK